MKKKEQISGREVIVMSNGISINPQLRIHNMLFHTRVLGPELRAAIWLQGCSRRCKGCMSPLTQPLDGGRLEDVEKIIHLLLAVKEIEGITISGGEPFLQADSLAYLLSELRQRSDLGIIIYTGYRLDELKEMNDRNTERIISLADIIIDGEYVDELNNGGALKGSNNQKVHFLSDRYLKYRAVYEEKVRNVEVFATERDLFMVGIPEKQTLYEYISAVNGIWVEQRDSKESLKGTTEIGK